MKLGNREKALYPNEKGMRSWQGQRTTRDREGTEENSWCLSQHLPSGGSHEELPAWICVPVGTVLSYRQAVCAELSSGLG